MLVGCLWALSTCTTTFGLADGVSCAEWMSGLSACMPGLDTKRNTDTKSRTL